jgi:hypothetical protein
MDRLGGRRDGAPVDGAVAVDVGTGGAVGADLGQPDSDLGAFLESLGAAVRIVAHTAAPGSEAAGKLKLLSVIGT